MLIYQLGIIYTDILTWSVIFRFCSFNKLSGFYFWGKIWFWYDTASPQCVERKVGGAMCAYKSLLIFNRAAWGKKMREGGRKITHHILMTLNSSVEEHHCRSHTHLCWGELWRREEKKRGLGVCKMLLCSRCLHQKEGRYGRFSTYMHPKSY